jgi:hypothetical protein
VKQRITVEQYKELTDKQKSILLQWWKPYKFDIIYWHVLESEETYEDSVWRCAKKEELIPLLSIGQLIELLHDKGSFNSEKPLEAKFNTSFTQNQTITIDWFGRTADTELCDSLWEAVRDIL